MCTVMSCLIKRTEAEISSKVYLTIHKLIITEDRGLFQTCNIVQLGNVRISLFFFDKNLKGFQAPSATSTISN